MTFYPNSSYKDLGFALRTGQGLNDSLGNDQCSTESAAVANGTTRATAFQMVAQLNYFTTVGASGVANLPKAIPGSRVKVYNYGANTLTIEGFISSDTIDTAASVTLSAANRVCTYDCYSPGLWVSTLGGGTSS